MMYVEKNAKVRNCEIIFVPSKVIIIIIFFKDKYLQGAFDFDEFFT